jgi:transposase
VVVPDNLKAGVKQASRYEPDLNPTYQDLAQHYGVAVLPARPRKPKDKSKAEVGVQVVERWILARLRNQIFFSLGDLNRAIRELLSDVNTRSMQHLGSSRRELFEKLDQPALKPLPEQPYEFALWKKARVNVDYHVAFERHYYSVPYTLSRREVYVRATENTIEVFYGEKRVASHPRSKLIGRHTTCADHMPPAHKKYLSYSPEHFVQQAQVIGPSTAQLVQAILDSRDHPQQAYRSCFGILGLAKQYGLDRLEAACRRALSSKLLSYKGVKNILIAKLDQLELAFEEPIPVVHSSHDNIRGSNYYS